MSVVFNQFVDHVFLRVTWSLLQTRLDLSIWRPVKSCVVNVWKECGFYSLKSYCFYIPSICINITQKISVHVHSLPLCLQAPKLHELSPISKILNCVYYRCMLLIKPLSAVKLWKDSDIRKRCFSNFKCNAYALIQYVKRIASNWYSPPVFGSTLLPCALSIRTVSGASSITWNKICFH